MLTAVARLPRLCRRRSSAALLSAPRAAVHSGARRRAAAPAARPDPRRQRPRRPRLLPRAEGRPRPPRPLRRVAQRDAGDLPGLVEAAADGVLGERLQRVRPRRPSSTTIRCSGTIKQIPGAFDKTTWRAAGQTVTLDQIEKTILPGVQGAAAVPGARPRRRRQRPAAQRGLHRRTAREAARRHPGGVRQRPPHVSPRPSGQHDRRSRRS